MVVFFVKSEIRPLGQQEYATNMADWTSEISSFKKFATSLQKFGEVGQKRINVVHTACVYCPYASAPYAFYMIFLNMREKAKTTCIGVDMHVWWSLARQIMF